MSSYPLPLSKDHKILAQEYCSGYHDIFGIWNNGFYCPQLESTTAAYCCGVPTYKYCCTMRQENEDDTDELAPFFIRYRTPVMVGIITGVTLVLLLITVASCFFCSCCFVYKKRRAHLTGGLYRMQCSSSSTASGLVNMYSPTTSTSNHNSLVTTPLDIEWSQQGQMGMGLGVGVAGGGGHNQNNQSLNHHGGHLMSLHSGAGTGLGPGTGNGYPSSLLPNGFPQSSHNNVSNNYSRLSLPRYQSQHPNPTPSQLRTQNLNQNQNPASVSSLHVPSSQSHQPNHLPPPVYYPQNHFSVSGAPYTLTGNNSANYTNTTSHMRQQLQQQQQQSRTQYHPNLPLSTIARNHHNQNLSSSNSQPSRIPGSILRVSSQNQTEPRSGTGTNNGYNNIYRSGSSYGYNIPVTSLALLSPSNSFTGSRTGSGNGSHRPSSEIITLSHGQQLQHQQQQHQHQQQNQSNTLPHPHRHGSADPDQDHGHGGNQLREPSASSSSPSDSTGGSRSQSQRNITSANANANPASCHNSCSGGSANGSSSNVNAVESPSAVASLGGASSPSISILSTSHSHYQVNGNSRSRSNNGHTHSHGNGNGNGSPNTPTTMVLCQSNLQKLASCLSSSDSQHEALSSSAL